MKKRVLIIQNVKANHHHVTYIDGLARALDRNKFEPIVVLQAGEAITDSYPPPNYELHLLPGATYSIPGQARFMSSVMSLLSRIGEIDVVHCSNPFSSVLPVLLHKRLHGRNYSVIYDMRGLWVEFGVHSGSFSPSLARILDQIDVAALKASNAVIAISPKLKEVLIRKGIDGGKIAVVPGGAELGQFAGVEPFGYRQFGWHGKVFGYVSSISKLRNSQDIIEAFDIVRQAVSEPVYLAMVGPVYEPEFFDRYVSERGLQDRVKFVGQVPHKQVPGYVLGADILVSYFPGEDYLFHQVSLPYKVIEYFAAGKPIVLSEQICHRNIACDGVDSLFVGSSVAGLAGGMLKLLGDEQLRLRLAAGAREAATRFSFAAISKTLGEVYERSRPA
jgi:glycosyltransferase involved in cell wall biosynthesis